MCTARLVSGTVSFTAVRVTLACGNLVVATGTEIATGHGGRLLSLVPLRRITRGRYTLILRSGHGRDAKITDTRITIH